MSYVAWRDSALRDATRLDSAWRDAVGRETDLYELNNVSGIYGGHHEIEGKDGIVNQGGN